MDLNQLFHGPNAGYLFELYESYLADPTSVDEATRTLFSHWRPTEPVNNVNGATPTAAPAVVVSADSNIAGVVNLANAIREFGYTAANINPLADAPEGDSAMKLERYGLTEAVLQQLPAHLVNGPIGNQSKNAAEAIAGLRHAYSGGIGYDYRQVANVEERDWLREAAESRRFHPDNMPLDGEAMLKRLTQVEGFEQFLHRTFQGKKRFSIEGLDMMVPMLDQIVEDGTDGAIRHIIMGMAHRGRLNVLTHVLQKPYTEMLAEFKDVVVDYEDSNWTGDVKYHSGRKRLIKGKVDLTVQIAANPSHLELVNPVVEGMARAAGSTANQSGEIEFDKESVLVIQIHGDAAFAGQGVVPETMNFNLLPGWRTGGTIHFIANNQIGFTTDYIESRSTIYASDVAKGFQIPIVHVNADDVEACVAAARLAFAYTSKFEKDFLIDLIGYRRYGHNEGDEPRMTQPTMYKVIDEHPTARQLWANELVKRGEISADTADNFFNAHLADMQQIYEQEVETKPSVPAPFVPDPQPQHKIETAVSAELLRGYNEALLNFPEGFEVHRGLKRVMKRRSTALDSDDSAEIDWGHAESLAFASILADKTPIRLTGEDVERGTFSHRHAILRDMRDGERFIPLQNIPQVKAAFQCRNSPLSENAALGFEYGYSIQAQNQLVLWEAQFGDFVNGAQPIIDEYISSAKAKWEIDSGLVLLLPHGYEGQGPDHSTARLERWLGMAADRNMRIVYPTTAANYFHLLRRQAQLLKSDPARLL